MVIEESSEEKRIKPSKFLWWQFASMAVPFQSPEGRATWTNSIEYLLSLLGYSVGYGNIIRFPYLTLVSGGGAFLIAYFTCGVLCGVPMYLLEIIMGQNSQRSCIACWDKFAPLFKGLGYTMLIISSIFTVSCQAVIAWTLYYIAASFTATLPWSHCNNTFNTENCIITTGNLSGHASLMGYDGNNTLLSNESWSLWTENGTIMKNSSEQPMSAAEEYWQYNVLRLSNSLEEIGTPNWYLFIAQVVGWVIIYLCLCKGVRSVGKIVWVTALGPYVLIIVFLVRAAILPGSIDGVKFYITPDFDRLLDVKTWMLAFIQIMHSLGIGWGTITTMSSYNRYDHQFIKDGIIAPLGTCFTSFLNGFVIFSGAGFLAYKTGMPVEKAISTGPGLAFITYPEVTSHLPAGQIWSILFFLMFFMVILDTYFVTIETVVSGINDYFKISKRYKYLVLLIIVILHIAISPIFLTNGGIYYLQLIDWYYANIGNFLVATMECITFVWIYNYKTLFKDIESMVGPTKVKFFILPLWGVVLPVLLLLGIGWILTGLSKPYYGTYQYPDWVETFGWTLSVCVAIPVLVYAIIKLISLKGPDKRAQIRALVKPHGARQMNENIPLDVQQQQQALMPQV